MEKISLENKDEVYNFAEFTLGLKKEDIKNKNKEVLHLTAVEDENGQNNVIKINGRNPKSEYDGALLSFSRAIVDGIIATGKILREEPHLTHQPFPKFREALSNFRIEELGKTEQPYSLIITSGSNLQFEHPIFQGRVIIYTRKDAEIEIPSSLENVTIERDENPDIRKAIKLLQDKYNANRISIEAGPSTNAQLYEEPLGVDSLWLSRFSGELDPSARGDEFKSNKMLEKLMKPTSQPIKVEEESGPWSFQRYTRR